MEEKLKKALHDTITSRINSLNLKKEQMLTKRVQLDELCELIDSLEMSFDKLKSYSREDLKRILTPYYPSNVLAEELDRLEVVRFAFSIQDKGYEIELNEEEIDIMIRFLEKIKNDKNVEYQKYNSLAPRSKERLNDEIKLLKQIEDKLSQNADGNRIIMGKEIDKIMQLAIEEEADEDTQIAILCLLNRMNLKAHTKSGEV